MDANLPVLCGSVSTAIFVVGTLPMIVKAARTRDLSSYSFSNIAMSNVGNVIASVYVFSLPPGPVWALHIFHLLSTALMLAWYVRYQVLGARSARSTYKSPTWRAPQLHGLPDAEVVETLLTSSYSSRPDRESELVGTVAGG
jgi:hypothetical protein